jgi:hypothetical protein
MAKPNLPPLKLSCSTTDCDNALHCFRKTKRESQFKPGTCQSCGAELIDWSRVQKKDVADVEHTLASLKKEWIRHQFWHRPLDQWAVNYARRKGRLELHAALAHRLRQCVGVKSTRDGRQTPWSKNPIYYAQHATACCCRRCIEYWHGIPPERPLTEGELDYFLQLCILYLKERLPDLSDHGVRVPPIRKKLPISAKEPSS